MLLRRMPVATTQVPETEVVPSTGVRRLFDQLLRLILANSLLTVAALGVGIRVAVAVVTRVLTTNVVVPDEAQYLSLARWMALGNDPNGWVPIYGPPLYRATRAFLLPLLLLFRYVSPARFVGQLLAIAFGVGAVVVTAWIVRRVLDARIALLTGIVLAALPSQVLFSSVVLRESQIWFWLAALAAACVLVGERSTCRVMLGVLAGTMAIIALGALRDQTMFVACWCAVAAMAFSRSDGRWKRVGGATLLALLLPVLGGAGIGGWYLVQRGIPALAQTRAQLSLDADTAFRDLTTAPPATLPPPSEGGYGTTTTTTLPTVGSYTGQLYVVDDSPAADFRAIPGGLVGVLLRPWPWERSGGAGLRLAAIESLAWYALYVLAAIGAWSGVRRAWPEFAFPVLVVIGLVLSAAVSQGNVGTAFRHRGQMAWALVLLGAEGAVVLLRRWRSARVAVAP